MRNYLCFSPKSALSYFPLMGYKIGERVVRWRWWWMPKEKMPKKTGLIGYRPDTVPGMNTINSLSKWDKVALESMQEMQEKV